LFVFEAAARTGNFSHAAQALGVTQPAVSRTIAALEARLGRQLFVRHGPKIELTTYGEQLSKTASGALAAIDDLIASWDQLDSDRDGVLLSISSAMATQWLIPRLGEFRERFPETDLRFELIAGTVTGNPLNKCDLGLRITPPGGMDPAAFYVQERIQPVGSAAYVREHGTLERPVPGKSHTFIALTDHWCSWHEFATRTGVKLPEPHQILTFTDYSVVLQTALSGQGLALGWISVTSKLLLDAVLVAASDAYLDTGKNCYLIGPGNRPISPSATAVRRWMIEQIWSDIGMLSSQSRPSASTPAAIALPARPNAH
jgi:DNA-binding transcriptional LysR family regulator